MPNPNRRGREAALDITRESLKQYLEKHQAYPPQPNPPCFEDWVAEIHPENATEYHREQGEGKIDPRFYVRDSLHLLLWNQNVEEDLKVPSALVNDDVEEQGPGGGVDENVSCWQDGQSVAPFKTVTI